MRGMKIVFSLMAGAMLLASVAVSAEQPQVIEKEINQVQRIRWGFDDAGGPANIERLPWAKEMFEEFGFNLWVVHAREYLDTDKALQSFHGVDAFCQANDVDFCGTWKAPTGLLSISIRMVETGTTEKTAAIFTCIRMKC